LELASLTFLKINDPSELFSDGSEEDPPELLIKTNNPLDENEFLLGMSNNQCLKALHPPKAGMIQLWEAFKDNVDPLTKIVHAPSMQKTIEAIQDVPNQVSKSLEALLFSIYYSAVNSLSQEECMSILGQNKEIAANRFRIGTKQALVNAAFLKSTSVVTLQAYVLFLVSCLTI
jgi:hypothetical protein